MTRPYKIDDQNLKKPLTANSSFQQKNKKTNYIDSERNYIKIPNLKIQNKVRVKVLRLGKYNPFFIFHDTVSPN